ncbi:MAG: DUF2809 domain-containing protein [Candidatus Poribacteria bacterium]|nr:DUF2809 domain-containing protein [Candidatus Poribacteria bacterium]
MSNRSRFFNSDRFIALRLKIIALLVIVTALGFASKFYRGVGAWWFNNSVAGLLYEVFWCLVLFFFFPRVKPLRLAFGVFVITCFLECLQLWHPPFLAPIRRSFIGQTLIGTTFSGWDFFYYVVGCGIGWLWLRRLSGGNRAAAG